jgi:hypothetical protein
MKSVEGRIKSALLDREHALAPVTDDSTDGIAVQRIGLEGAKDQEIQSARE